MTRQLRMSEEIHDWLAALHGSDPNAARLFAEAVTALLNEGSSLRPPTVTPALAPPGPADPYAALDEFYQLRLQDLQTMRRQVADIAATRQNLADRIARLEGAREPKWDKISALREQLGRVTEAEARLTERSQREQRRVEVFRTRKETLKARLTSAKAQAAVYESLAEMDAVDAASGEQDEDLGASISGAGDRVKEIEQEIREALSGVVRAVMRPGQEPEPALMELRAGSPGDDEIHVLFAAEPPGAVLLIAVLEGRDAWQDQRDEAISLSSELLRLVRAGQAPEAVARQYEGPRAFLDEFFPVEAGLIEAGAAELAARNRGLTLAEQRDRLGLTRAQVAERMGVREERIVAIERADSGATEVRTLTRYIEALGGRLEIIADFGDDRSHLR
jgi:DNA-binding XRE family transcriptional regulator